MSSIKICIICFAAPITAVIHKFFKNTISGDPDILLNVVPSILSWCSSPLTLSLDCYVISRPLCKKWLRGYYSVSGSSFLDAAGPDIIVVLKFVFRKTPLLSAYNGSIASAGSRSTNLLTRVSTPVCPNIVNEGFWLYFNTFISIFVYRRSLDSPDSITRVGAWRPGNRHSIPRR
jgi:hypothetical protein